MTESMDSPYEIKDLDLASDAVWHKHAVSPTDRARLMQQTPRCIWLTGLSGSGKSTVANALDVALHSNGAKTFLLDGDNVRHGLNKDLGMTETDRAENIRRVGEVSKLMVDAGLIVICAFISPYQRDRQMVRSIFAPGQFLEVYLDTPLEVCEERDPKGLYKKAREGVIKQFTGVSDPYEAPEAAEVVIDTSKVNVEKAVKTVLNALA
ncbi:adenylyl-sulfate kinase [Saccharospirillum salsuginis]|uniref:Adenylyl-sulfate kinase n=1 Tax=Saccharospirillum salsuginis TaxID=418750 RepID=A0A918KDW7_9GAMM|nr:adenylyl-sulfate kinase [Saccharospirillum salsuginis]GGX60078.1 adenylyl-sulfate kinase [Saccharospirillum salsuginis]